MGFTEFIEAISRVADRLTIPNPLKDKTAQTVTESLGLAILLNVKQRPLPEKIEAYLLTLAKTCLPPGYYQHALPALK